MPGPTDASHASRVFVACSEAGYVEEFRLRDGVLERTGGRVDVADVRTLAFDAARCLLYAVRNAGAPACITIDARVPGLLRPVHRRALPATTTYAALSGSWLFSASYLDSCAIAIGLDEHGLPSGREVVTSPGRQVHCVDAAPGSAHVYAVCLSDDTILRADADGRFSWAHCWSAPAGRGPRHLRFTRERAYAVDELTAQLEVFDVDQATGALHHRATVDALPGTALIPGRPRNIGGAPPAPDAIWASDVAITPDGRLAMLTERTGSTVSMIGLDTQSVLAVHPTERQPRAVAVDASGRYLLTAGERSGRIRVAALGDDGGLTVTDVAETGAGPLWLTLSPAAP